MKLLIDMNLPEEWIPILAQHGYEAVLWSSTGNPIVEDSVIMAGAGQHGYTVFTHDLDFGALLAISGAARPSIFQVRTLGVMPHQIESLVIAALEQFAPVLESGALVSVEEKRSRARILPLLR